MSGANSKSLVKPGMFLKWLRDDQINDHMNDTTINTTTNHAQYIRLARNSFSLMRVGGSKKSAESVVTRSSRSMTADSSSVGSARTPPPPNNA